MAITGSGTQGDPWVAQTYTDLSTIFSDKISLGYGNYIKLGNDIDCNAYGESFEWETLSSTYSTRWFDFDLDGHTIQNIKVAADNNMFTTGGGNRCDIRNGKILNLFLSEANGLASCSGELYFSNLSISTNVTGARSYLTSRAFFENCSLYAEGIMSSMICMNYDEQLPLFKNCDIKLAIDNLNEKRIFGKDSNFGGVSIGFDNCRIRGYVKGATASNCVVGMCSMVNSVCDLDTLQTTHSGLISAFGAGGTGVCNSDKLADGISAGGSITEVTSQEIINGEALRTEGFVVVNTVQG